MKPVRVKMRDDDLATNRLRGVGFRGVSTEGWEGPVRAFRADAVRDVRDYHARIAVAAAKPPDAYTMTPPGTTGAAQ